MFKRTKEDDLELEFLIPSTADILGGTLFVTAGRAILGPAGCGVALLASALTLHASGGPPAQS